jgi:gliding motility-associated-like protein
MRWAVVSVMVFICLQATDGFGQQLVIRGQKTLSVQQNKSITLQLSDLFVDADPDFNYPNGFYLDFDKGETYTVSGNTITPAKDFSGILTVKLRVTNGKKKSNKFSLAIEVIKSPDGGQGANQKPRIVGQVKVQITQGQTFTIKLSHLTVEDADDPYPEGFSLKLESGANFTLTETTVIPTSGFTGNLLVKVKVNDGETDSGPYNFIITVTEISQNVKPIITGQKPVNTFKNEPFVINLTDITVTDPDNNFPSDFSMIVLAGTNYTSNGTVITPAPGYAGQLFIKVKVSEGSNESDVFDFLVNVIDRGSFQIVGQTSISILEDSSYVFNLSDLTVNDPTNVFPADFVLTILRGEHYQIDGTKLIPESNYYGELIVPIAVSKPGFTSEYYHTRVIVHPVNDPAEFSYFESSIITIHANGVETPIAGEVIISDVDNQTLAYAEVQLDSADDKSFLSFSSTENLRGIFDQATGTLLYVGDAVLAEYETALHSLKFSTTDSATTTRKISFRLNDGSTYSSTYEKLLVTESVETSLIIPQAFTPNNDNSNDTWEVYSEEEIAADEIDVKIYNSNGLLLFESDSPDFSWDGRYKGDFLPAGSYFYTLEISYAGKQERRRGTVTILR